MCVSIVIAHPEPGFEGPPDRLVDAPIGAFSRAAHESRGKKNPNSRSGLNPPKEEVEETCVVVKHRQPIVAV